MAFSGAGPGRPKGVPNKMTTAVKEAVLNALDELGGVSYLVTVGKENPAVFCALLGKILPTQVEGTGEDGKIIVSWSNE